MFETRCSWKIVGLTILEIRQLLEDSRLEYFGKQTTRKDSDLNSFGQQTAPEDGEIEYVGKQTTRRDSDLKHFGQQTFLEDGEIEYFGIIVVVAVRRDMKTSKQTSTCMNASLSTITAS